MGNDRQGNDRSRTTPLRVRFRGERTRVPSVFCPRRLKSVETTECGRCKHGHGLSFDISDCALYMDCGWPRSCPYLPGGEMADETEIASLIGNPVHCVTQDAQLDSVLPTFLAGAIDAAAVVDGSGRAIGILSKTDLLRWYGSGRPTDASPSATAPIAIEGATAPCVRDAMSHLVYTLHADADIARAAALMAYEGVHQIVVTDVHGRPIGMVSSLDILGCIARRNGYIMTDSE